MFPGLPALAGLPAGGLPQGFSGSSAAESSSGPITVGGFTFAPDSTSTITSGVIVVAVVFAALMLVKKAR